MRVTRRVGARGIGAGTSIVLTLLLACSSSTTGGAGDAGTTTPEAGSASTTPEAAPPPADVTPSGPDATDAEGGDASGLDSGGPKTCLGGLGTVAPPRGTSDSCTGGGGTGCPEDCGGGGPYQCGAGNTGLAPEGVPGCYMVTTPSNPVVCCPGLQCVRHAANDAFCPGARSFWCNPGVPVPTGCALDPTRTTYCCP